VGLVFGWRWLWSWCLRARGTKDEMRVASLWGWCLRGGSFGVGVFGVVVVGLVFARKGKNGVVGCEGCRGKVG
jgi:hypothetical protein